MMNLIFMLMLAVGTVTQAEKNDDRQMYNLECNDGTVIEYAYKEEILEYIETGTFEYDEMLGQ